MRSRILFESSVIFRHQRRQITTAAVRRQATQKCQELQVTDLLDVYRGLVTQGRLNFDEDQVRVIMELRRLQKRLTNYAPSTFISSGYTTETDSSQKKPWWSHTAEDPPVASGFKSLVQRKSHADEIAALDTPKGLFLTGPPGSGKTMLIDLWLSLVPTPYKARKHYSTLVLEIYRGVWEETRRRQALFASSPVPTPQAPGNKAMRERWRAFLASGSFPVLRSSNHNSDSPHLPSIPYIIARRLLLSHWLLVFDEVQLLDVSSAGLLSDVLSWFWRMGGVIVGSSNKVPDDLYRNGVQKERLEPFVEALKLRCPVLHLNVTNDYRELKAGHGHGRTWFSRGQEKEFENMVHKLGQGARAVSSTITIFGRSLSVRQISATACQFTFEELCDRSLGPADYISLTSQYSTIVLTGVPVIRVDAKNQGRRFISLVDALYESRCRLICMADSELDGLFFPETPSRSSGESNESLMMAESMSEAREVYRPNVSSYDSLPKPLKLSQLEHPRLEMLSIFSGEEEAFAYKRAYSRLLEMTSTVYTKDEEWWPLPSDSRRWETSGSIAGKKEMDARTSLNDSESNVSGDDFVTRAGYPPLNREWERPPPPKLREDHIWGVREDWGPRAKAWGKGAAIHKVSNDNGRDRKS